MFLLVTIDPDTVDIYETTEDAVKKLTDLVSDDIAYEYVAIDEQATPWCNDLPQPLLEKWLRFVQVVVDTYGIEGMPGDQWFEHRETGEQLTFTQLVARHRDIFAPVAQVYAEV